MSVLPSSQISGPGNLAGGLSCKTEAVGERDAGENENVQVGMWFFFCLLLGGLHGAIQAQAPGTHILWRTVGMEVV